MRIETLREVIEATGGELCITVRFSDAEYPVGMYETWCGRDTPEFDDSHRPY